MLILYNSLLVYLKLIGLLFILFLAYIAYLTLNFFNIILGLKGTILATLNNFLIIFLININYYAFRKNSKKSLLLIKVRP